MIRLAQTERKERKEGRGGVPGGGKNKTDEPPPRLCWDAGI